MLVEALEITVVLPCLADPSKIRFHARAPADLTPVLPYLNAIIAKAIYNPTAHSLTLYRDYRIICLQGSLITGAKADDTEDARSILDWLKRLINDTWERRSEITPSYDRRERLTPLPVFELLPRANCRRCGLPTCLAFAVEVAAERLSVIRCGPLFDAAHQAQRRRLLELLVAAGYEVPSAFRPSQEGL
jgi:ArsR family metal-binding transcriptional regulator